MKYKTCKYIKAVPTEQQLKRADKLNQLKLANAAFSRKQIKLKHLLTWDQKYKKLNI